MTPPTYKQSTLSDNARRTLISSIGIAVGMILGAVMQSEGDMFRDWPGRKQAITFLKDGDKYAEFNEQIDELLRAPYLCSNILAFPHAARSEMKLSPLGFIAMRIAEEGVKAALAAPNNGEQPRAILQATARVFEDQMMFALCLYPEARQFKNPAADLVAKTLYKKDTQKRLGAMSIKYNLDLCGDDVQEKARKWALVFFMTVKTAAIVTKECHERGIMIDPSKLPPPMCGTELVEARKDADSPPARSGIALRLTKPSLVS